MEKIKTGMIIVLLIIIAILTETRPKKQEPPQSNDHFQFDSTKVIIKPKTPPLPLEPIIKYIHVHDKEAVDSAAVFKAYEGKYHYSQIVKNDSAAYIKITQVISQNRPIAQKITFIPRIPKTIIEPYSPPAIRILAGIILSGNQNTFNPRVSVGILSRKDNFYFAGYDPINKSISLGFLFKIRLRKRK